MENQPQEQFSQWALLELFGHQRIAGLVTEAKIGAGAFVRVDVPDKEGNTLFTKFYNPGAIYAISPIDKQIAIHLAESLGVVPVAAWDVTKLAKTMQPALPEPAYSGSDSDLDEEF